MKSRKNSIRANSEILYPFSYAQLPRTETSINTTWVHKHMHIPTPTATQARAVSKYQTIKYQ